MKKLLTLVMLGLSLSSCAKMKEREYLRGCKDGAGDLAGALGLSIPDEALDAACKQIHDSHNKK